MRAWQVRSHGSPTEALELVDVDAPEPGPGQLRVRVRAAGLGLPDVLMCRGTYPLTPALPFTPGQEVVGEVTAAGEGAGTAVGTRVMAVTAFPTGSGGFAEEALVYDASAFPVPHGLADEDAAGFWIPHLTAWIGLVDRAALAPGEWLVVLGAAGGSGIAAVQLGRALGGRVVAVVGSEAKAELCRRVGSEAVLVGSDALPARLREATEGHGADAIYDPVGGEPAAEAARALARNGRHLAVGFASGAWPALDVAGLVRANASLVGVYAGGYDRPSLDAIHDRLGELVATGAIRSTVTSRAAFDELPQALERLADRRAAGKSVLSVA